MSYKDPEISVSKQIPPLAWHVEVSDGKVLIETGEHVEAHRNGATTHILEGAWDGPFEKFGFSDAENFFGSGVTVSPESICFSTSTHTLDCLYLITKPRGISVSNSLAFLYARAGLRLKPGTGIFDREVSINKGVRSYDRVLCRQGDLQLERLAFCNFTFANGHLKIRAKKKTPPFTDYESYKTYLIEHFSQVLENAADRKRGQSYAPLATLSSGYDSTAGAAICAAVGCEAAITIESSRFGEVDSGQDIAAALGLSCALLPRADMPTSEEPVDAEFIASGCGGDVALVGFSDRLEGTLVSTGYHGDAVWDLDRAPSDDINRGVARSGSGLTEFRLRQNFINAPVPFMGVVRHDDLRRISRSEEMQPYRIGGDYDRPIPRRIAEEAGVPREAFGQRKRAINILLNSQERMLTPAMHKATLKVIRDRLGKRRFVAEKLHEMPRQIFSGFWKIGVAVSRRNQGALAQAGKALSLAAKKADSMFERAIPFTLFYDAMFIAAIEETSKRYNEL